jgi:hypothetical protein
MTIRAFSTYTVDRFEDDAAVLEASDGSMLRVRRSSLPSIVSEGDVIQAVPAGACGIGFRLLHSATAEERRAAAERLGRLESRDPGGDLTL